MGRVDKWWLRRLHLPAGWLSESQGSVHRAMPPSPVWVRALRQDKSVEDTLSSTAFCLRTAQSQDSRRAGIQVVYYVERPPWPAALPIKLSAYLRRQELIKGAPRGQEKAFCGAWGQPFKHRTPTEQQRVWLTSSPLSSYVVSKIKTSFFVSFLE